jgi:hypothetical protein
LATLILEAGKYGVFVRLQPNQVDVLDGDFGAQPNQDYEEAWPEDELEYGANGRSLAVDEVFLRQCSKVLAAP